MSGDTLFGNDRELAMLGRAAAEFAAKQLAPDREKHDRYPFGPFFDQVLEKAFELDFFHIMLPEKFNGTGQGARALSVVLDRICREDASLAGIIFTCSAALQILMEAGADRELEKIAVSENVSGFLTGFPVYTDPAQTPPAVSAKPANGRYILTGTADYVVLGSMAPRCIVAAKTGGQNDGYGFFLVDMSQDGVTADGPLLSLGLRACPAADLKLEGAEGLPLGDVSAGGIYFSRMADRLHGVSAAMAAGIMKGSFSEAFSYSRGRFQGGQQIIRWSEMKMMLSKMAVRIKNADMILESALCAVDSRTRGWQKCSVAAALEIQAAACEVTSDGIQALGGVGYMKDFGQEKRFRDARHIQCLLGMAPVKRIRYLESMMR